MLTYTCHERTVVFWSPFFDSSNWTSTSAGKTRSKLKIKLQPFVVSCFKRFSIEYQNIFSTVKKNDDSPFFPPQEEKKSLKERLQAIQEVTQTVQNSIGYIASLCERVKNLFNFTVPYLSYLAMILAILGAVVLYFIPLRYLILTWGVNKFSRKIVRPHSVPNNELLDLISRVPDDEELLNYRFLSLRTKGGGQQLELFQYTLFLICRELKPLPTADCEKGSGSPGASNQTRREQRKRHKAA